MVTIEEGLVVEILPAGSGLKLLGTVLTLQGVTPAEIPNGVTAGWKMFWASKRILQNQKISLKRRMKPFDATVGSCVLWCAQSWTPRVEDLRCLETARRAMLRRMLGPSRLESEEWTDWIKRVTRKVVALASVCKVRNWSYAHAHAKWLWAGHVARMPGTTWAWKVTPWRDSEWNAWAMESGAVRPLRPSTRRWMKWEETVRRHCASTGLGTWRTLASDRDAWRREADTFAKLSTELKE